MFKELVHEDQPLRCMTNYYDYRPSSPALHDTSGPVQPTVRRSIPGRMANYMEDRSYQAQSGYRKIEEPMQPQPRKTRPQDVALVRQEHTIPLASCEDTSYINW